MKPGSVLRWKKLDHRHHSFNSSLYIVIKRTGCALFLYDVEDGELFLANHNWVYLKLEEAA